MQPIADRSFVNACRTAHAVTDGTTSDLCKSVLVLGPAIQHASPYFTPLSTAGHGTRTGLCSYLALFRRHRHVDEVRACIVGKRLGGRLLDYLNPHVRVLSVGCKSVWSTPKSCSLTAGGREKRPLARAAALPFSSCLSCCSQSCSFRPYTVFRS